MSTAAAAARALRAVTHQLPPGTLARLDEELRTVLDLVADVLTGSTRHDEIMSELGEIRSGLIQELHDHSGRVAQALETKAAELARDDSAPATGSAPATPGTSSKAAELNNAPVPRTRCKDSNKQMQILRDDHGWGWEKRTSHVYGYGPDGDSMTVSMSPSGPESLNRLTAKIKQQRRKPR